MVIADLGVVDTGLGDGTPVFENIGHKGGKLPFGHRPQPFGQGGDDILREIAGISAGIGQGLVGFIQPLHHGQGFLRGHLIELVGVPLQLGQIVEHGRGRGFIRRFHLINPEFLALDFLRQRLRLVLVEEG